MEDMIQIPKDEMVRILASINQARVNLAYLRWHCHCMNEDDWAVFDGTYDRIDSALKAAAVDALRGAAGRGPMVNSNS